MAPRRAAGPSAAIGALLLAQFCSALLPETLTNFQGFYACDSKVAAGRPRDVREMQAQVKEADRARATGLGHSWNREYFCAAGGGAGKAINVNTRTLLGKKIAVDEAAWTVTVDAGVTQRELLDHLATYGDGAGWTLSAFSWFIDQTIGGAVATDTHGSSLKHGSLSRQVHSLRMILANGTLAEFSDRSDRHLMRAARVGVGRLGIIVDVTFHIVPQISVRRDLQETSFDVFLNLVLGYQNAFNSQRQARGGRRGLQNEPARNIKGPWQVNNNIIPPVVKKVPRGLQGLDELQAYWFVPTREAWVIAFKRLEVEPKSVLFNAPNAFEQGEPLRPVPPLGALEYNSEFWSNFYASAVRFNVGAGTYEARNSYISMSEAQNIRHATAAPYDQYEFSVPLSRAGSCLHTLREKVYGPARLWEGFRTQALIRFVADVDAYLSHTSGEPAMLVNIEDYVAKTSGRPNEEFLEVARIFREECGARIHWGKAGWPSSRPDAADVKCFDGAAEYPGWCDFGCAAHDLDPGGKFEGTSGNWVFHVSRDGRNATLAECCGSNGLMQGCRCERRCPYWVA